MKARDVFRLSIQHDPERGYYIAAQVGSIRPGYRRITGYYKDTYSAAEAFDAIGAEPADHHFVLKYGLY